MVESCWAAPWQETLSDLTLGLFDTIVGYEVEASASNPNVSRSYGYDLEPFTHTGLLASTTLTDNVSISLGLANAFDSTGGLHNDDQNGDFGYLAGLEVTAPDSLGPLSGSTVYVGFVEGADEEDSLLYVGASIPTPIEGLSLGVAYDDRESAAGDAEATAVYATYGLSETMNLGLRYDTIEDDRAGAWEGDTRSALTATLGIALWDNVLTRIEYIAEDGNRAGGSSNGFALNAFYSF